MTVDTIMKNKLNILGIPLVALGLLTLPACEDSYGPAEEVGEAIDDATDSRPAEGVQDAVEDAADAVKDATN